MRLIALDSCAIADTAREFFNTSSPHHQAALQVVTRLGSNTLVPALSLLQLHEIVSHADSRAIAQRLRLLQALPRIAWVRNTVTNPVGAALYEGESLDLIYLEVSAWQSSMSLRQICAEARRSAFVVAASGPHIAELVDRARATRIRTRGAEHFQAEAELQRALNRNMASISMTVAEARARMTRDISELATNAMMGNASLAAHLSSARSKDSPPTTPYFQRAVESFRAATPAVIGETHKTPFDAFLDHVGVAPGEIDDSESFHEIGKLVGFRRYLDRIMADRTTHLSRAQLRSLRPHMIPTCRLHHLFRDEQESMRTRAVGSDILDANIVAMSLYCDLAVVDKRTHEAATRIWRRHPDIRSAMCRLMKWPGVARAAAVLAHLQ